MTRRVLLIAALLLAFVCVAAPAQIGIRNISSAQVDAFFDGTVAVDINQVLLFPVVDWLSAEFKVQRQDSRQLSETTISVAPIFLPGGGVYIIARYGLGIGTGTDNSGEPAGNGTEFSHDVAIDANYESAELYANVAVRGSIYPDDSYWFILPTAALQVKIGEQARLLGRYFFSYNSLGATSHALLAELTYRISDTMVLSGGASGGLGLEDSGIEWEVTGLGGIGIQISPTVRLRYQLEYLGRIGQPDGIRNVLSLDASF